MHSLGQRRRHTTRWTSARAPDRDLRKSLPFLRSEGPRRAVTQTPYRYPVLTTALQSTLGHHLAPQQRQALYNVTFSLYARSHNVSVCKIVSYYHFVTSSKPEKFAIPDF